MAPSYAPPGDFGRPPIVVAAMNNDADRARQLLDDDPTLLTYLDAGVDTPLHLAAKTNSCRVAGLLIERGAPLNLRGATGETPLHCAAYVGHVKIVRLLLESGADPTITDDFGCTPLVSAARNFDSTGRRVAKLMLKHGVKCGLHAAICLGRVGEVDSILRAEPHVLSQYDHPGDLLHDAMRFIVTAGVDVGGPDGFQRAIKRYGQICELLVKAGVSPDLESRWGDPVLHQYVDFGYDTEVIEFILDFGADPNAMSKAGETPLQIALRNEQTELAALLRSRGAK